jgi:diacylglycerol kinase family enzyme
MSIRWLAIVNPYAGYSHSANWQRLFSERLRRELDADVVFTEHRGHATELARASNVEGLAVFGGDGTIAEVVNGMNLDQQRLLLLPGGTGNGLARDLRCGSIEMLIAAANSAPLLSLDLIIVTFRTQSRVHRRLAISTASIGYAAEVVALANRYFKRLGKWCYPLAATLQAARQTAFPLRVSVDDGKLLERQLSNIMVNNTRHAGNFSAFRASNLSDGLMEMLLARSNFIGQFLHNLAVLTKTYFYQTAAEISVRRLSVALLSPQRLMIDGELWENVIEASFEVLPGKLRCVA